MATREMGVGIDNVVTLATTLGKVTDISSLAVFLLSDLNTYLTGQNIIIDEFYESTKRPLADSIFYYPFLLLALTAKILAPNTLKHEVLLHISHWFR